MLFLNAIATPLDYRLAGFAVRAEGVEWTGVADVKVPAAGEVDWAWQAENLTDGDLPNHTAAVLGVPDAITALQDHAPDALPYYLKLLGHNQGAAWWTLAGVGLWMTAVPTQLLEWMDRGRWWEAKLTEWITHGKNKLNVVRRSLALHGTGKMHVDLPLLLRKLGNICARSKDDADWAAEEHRRVINTPAHFYPAGDGSLDRETWKKEAGRILTQFSRLVVGKMGSDMRLEHPTVWWNSRVAWAPQGSAEMSKLAVKEIEDAEGMEHDSARRANKRAVAATLPDEFYALKLASMPLKVPRRSTKNEPGLKNRALFAQDDGSFWVSSYSSVAMEKNICEEGIFAQQTPADVAGWVENHRRAVAAGEHFLSLDYSDYNSEHEHWMLERTDLAFAEAWDELLGTTEVGRHKAYAARWAAYAHQNAWVDFGEGQVRVLGGLFSGDRNTSRDNCILHHVYSTLMRRAAREHMDDFCFRSIAMTGDDEDATFGGWVDALLYMSLHARAGFVLKVEKQLAGDANSPTHEYLQRALTGTNRPSQPLAAAMAQVCSGNWYKETYTWLDGLITATTQNCWELVVRGLPLGVARFMATRILNRLMQVRAPGGGWIKLEWWAFRSPPGSPPLWEAVTRQPPPVPTGESAIRGPVHAPGMLAWEQKNWMRFRKLLTKPALERYMLGVSKNVYGSLYPKERNRVMHAHAAEWWPQRGSVDSTERQCELVGRCTQRALDAVATAQQGVRQPMTEAQLASRFGLDLDMLQAIGGWKRLLQALPPEDMQHFTSLDEQGADPGPFWWEDAALRSQAVGQLGGLWSTAAPLPTAVASGVHLVLAPNASGKTTSIMRNYGVDIVDWDAVLRQSGCLSYVKNSATAGDPHLPRQYVQQAARVARQMGCRVVLSQYPPALVLPIVRALGLEVKQVSVVRPRASVLYMRASRSRGWSIDKLHRRLARYARAVASWDLLGYDINEHLTLQSAVDAATNY